MLSRSVLLCFMVFCKQAPNHVPFKSEPKSRASPRLISRRR